LQMVQRNRRVGSSVVPIECRRSLKVKRGDVMAFRVHSDRVVIIEGPVGFNRTWWLPEANGG